MVDSDSDDTYNSYITKAITDIPITVTLSTPTKDIGKENKDSAPTTPYHNQITLETELTALKSFVPEQFFLIKKTIQEIKDPNHEVASLTYVAMLMGQMEYLKDENKIKNSIVQSLTNQYNDIMNSATTCNSNNNSDINNSNNNNNNDNNLHKSIAK